MKEFKRRKGNNPDLQFGKVQGRIRSPKDLPHLGKAQIRELLKSASEINRLRAIKALNAGEPEKAHALLKAARRDLRASSELPVSRAAVKGYKMKKKNR